MTLCHGLGCICLSKIPSGVRKQPFNPFYPVILYPLYTPFMGWGVIILPLYNPAYGLGRLGYTPYILYKFFIHP